MKPAPRRWDFADAAPIPGHPPVLGSVLAARGFDERSAVGFLAGEQTFHDPFALRGMDAAVTTLAQAIREQRRIAVYGDYDTDGVTACALLIRTLRSAGADVVPYIPHRMREGYGLHGAALAELGEQGIGCVITVDCGTSNVEAARDRPAGMQLVITDHHLPPAAASSPGAAPELAQADALINPKQPGCRYPFDGLAGAGVAFKLVQALEESRIVPAGSADAALGFAALGTVADMMPLHGENRWIVRLGMKQLTAAPGIRALCELAQLGTDLRATDLGFALGPRINAAGRMEDARLALALCLADDLEESRNLALQLESQNRVRQEAVATALQRAEEYVAELDDDAAAIVLADADWAMGIVGLVAGRIAERYARPTFAIALDSVEAKGSARTSGGVHLVTALDGAADTLHRYGGHAVAAGFSLDPARVGEFRSAITDAVARQLGVAPRERLFRIDAELTAADARPDLCRTLDCLEPCGQGNHQPILALRGAQVLFNAPFGSDRQHLRVTLADGTGLAEAIAFFKPNLGAHLPRGRLVDLCCSVELDSWQGQERVRLRLRDIRPAVTSPARVAAATVSV